MPEDAPREGLPRTVRVGYGMGSVATGAFGTVPGLLLLPYLTDTLGIAAAAAGGIVFLPKAWDVLLNPVAGRISDRHVSAAGPRRPFLLRAGAALAVCFALLFAGPDLGSPAADATYVVAAFLACATAYAFFQVPFVAMPAEITDSYDERTRLLSWRVALLALAILVSGALSPAIRDAIGGRDGYRAMGLFVAALILVGTFGAYFGTRRAPVGSVVAAGGSLAAQLRVVAASRDFRMLLATFVVQALAVGAMLAGVDYVSRQVLDRPGASTILFVCFVGPALLLTPGVGPVRDPRRQEARVPVGIVVPRGRCVPARRDAGAPRRRGVPGDGARRCRVRRGAGVPDVDAARHRRRGRRPLRPEPDGRLHRCLDGR